MSSTAPRSSYFSALSVASYCLYSLVAVVNWRRMSAICGPVLPAGMTGSGTELTGGMKGMRLRVLYAAGRTVRKRRPRAPLPK